MTLEEEVKKLREEMELVKQNLRRHVRSETCLASNLLLVEKQIVGLYKLHGVNPDPSFGKYHEERKKELEEDLQRMDNSDEHLDPSFGQKCSS